MRNCARLTLLSMVVTLAVACGSENQQPAQQPSNSPAPEAPASSGAGGPATAQTGTATATPSTAGGEMRAAAPAGSAPAAAVPPASTMVTLDVPSGTELVLTLDTGVSSDTARPEQTVRATVARPVIVDGTAVIPEGAVVTGTVVSAERSGRVKGLASIALRFNEVTVARTPYRINTSRIAREAEATKGEDATKIGIGAGVGTAIGAIAGGKKGAAIGAGIGGGAGAGAVLATRGKEVSIPAGATLRTRIQEAVSITVPVKGS
jgi:hypothetical protein